MYILKYGRTSTRTPSYEERLLGYGGKEGMISKGTLTDKDINFVLKSGDSKLKKALDEKYRREKKNSEHIKRVHGSAFVNKDNNGNLYVDKDLGVDVANTIDTPEDVKKMQEILKK